MSTPPPKQEKQKIKPINPKDIKEIKLSMIPDEVIEAVNELIVAKWNSRSAAFTQDELIVLILQKLNDGNLETYTRDRIFDEHMLEFEPIFIKAGWKVAYESPDRNETWNAFFRFTK